MSRINLGCKFCDEQQFETDGTIKIDQRDINDKLWLELFMLDNRTITAYVTEKESWDPKQEIDLKVNYCPMCGRKLYSDQEERFRDYDFRGREDEGYNNRKSRGRQEYTGE